MRLWLLTGCVFVALFGGGAAYIHHAISTLSPSPAIETISLRTYAQKRLPELEAVADRQELVDELKRFVAKTERLLRAAQAVETSSRHTLTLIPRFLAATAVIFLFVTLVGYSLLRRMKEFRDEATPPPADANAPRL